MFVAPGKARGVVVVLGEEWSRVRMAAKYRKIDPRMWDDEKFCGLSEGEKLVAIYCITAQSNRIGLFKFSPAQAAERLDLSTKTFGERFGKVCRVLKWRYDADRRVLYLPTWWKYNEPENQNVLVGALKDLHELPRCNLIKDFADNTQYIPETLLETFAERISERYINLTSNITGNPAPIQEQEQEQEQEQDGASPEPSAGFPEFWSAYPNRRKANKTACQNLWRSRKLAAASAEIMAGLKRWKESQDWSEKGGQFIPGPHPWLNQEKWMAHPSPAIQSEMDGWVDKTEDQVKALLDE